MKENDLLKLEQLADLMDNRFTLPGTDIRIGLDGLLGLIPGIGDTLSMAVSGYIIHKAREAGMHPLLTSRMVWNVFIDWLIGLVPFFGDIFDIGWKANRKNIALLKEHLKARSYETAKSGHALFI